MSYTQDFQLIDVRFKEGFLYKFCQKLSTKSAIIADDSTHILPYYTSNRRILKDYACNIEKYKYKVGIKMHKTHIKDQYAFTRFIRFYFRKSLCYHISYHSQLRPHLPTAQLIREFLSFYNITSDDLSFLSAKKMWERSKEKKQLNQLLN